MLSGCCRSRGEICHHPDSPRPTSKSCGASRLGSKSLSVVLRLRLPLVRRSLRTPRLQMRVRRPPLRQTRLVGDELPNPAPVARFQDGERLPPLERRNLLLSDAPRRQELLTGFHTIFRTTLRASTAPRSRNLPSAESKPRRLKVFYALREKLTHGKNASISWHRFASSSAGTNMNLFGWCHWRIVRVD